jgi:hypothetical protein
MSRQDRRTVDRDTIFQQKLIHEPIVVSEKYFGNSSNPASYDSHYSFKANIQNNVLKKNPSPVNSHPFLEMPKKPSYESHLDIPTKHTHIMSLHTSNFTQKSKTSLKDHPFENSYLRNQIENVQSLVSQDPPDSLSFRPNTGGSTNKANLKIRDFSISIEQFKTSPNPNKNTAPPKSFGQRDKVLRKAALKYFNNFESLSIKKAQRERLNQSAFVNPSGHILLDRPRTRTRTPIKKRNDPLISTKTHSQFPEILKKIRAPTPIERIHKPLYDVPNKVGPTRITYIEDLERKYQFLLDEQQSYQSNSSYYY